MLARSLYVFAGLRGSAEKLFENSVELIFSDLHAIMLA